MICDRCQRPLVVGDWPFCPHGQGHATVIGDELDHWQVNGTNTPIHFRSKADRKAWLTANGLEEMARHVPTPGSDKSPFTSDWSKMTDPYTMGYKRELLERAFKQRADPPRDAAITLRPLDAADLAALDQQYNGGKGA